MEDSLAGRHVIHPELGDNVCFDRALDTGEVDSAFARADVVVEETYEFGRHTGVCPESRSLLADYNPAEHALTVYHSTQAPHMMQDIFSRHLDIPEQQILRGVYGFDAAPLELEFALRAVTNGETYLSPKVSTHVVRSYVRPLGAESGLEPLSPRQREILKAISSGRTTKQIAYDLGLSIKTIETHRAQIMERLDIHDVAGLVRFAIRNGLISVND
jgi:DNA-binding CsgD family transcriptional regulator